MPQAQYHLLPNASHFADVLLPLAIPKTYTYAIPPELLPEMQFGIRVEVPLRNKLYSGLVVNIHEEKPPYDTKPIVNIIDSEPIVIANQLKLWRWIADYYCCSMGEVMNAALPANMKLVSETIVTINPLFDDSFTDLTDKEYLIAEALTIQNELSVEEIQGILQQKTVYRLIDSLLHKGVLQLKEEIKTKFKPKLISCVRLSEKYAHDSETLREAFDLVGRADRQLEALMAFIQISKGQSFIKTQEIYEKANVDNAVLKAMVKKGIFEIYEKEVSRIGGYEDEVSMADELTAQQALAIEEIQYCFGDKNVALLQGVTGSGKTRVYVELIQKVIKEGKQVLYLLPEISLTTQIISRLQRIFGNDIAVYHSKLNNNERVELWNIAFAGKPIILGVRSALFLPFQNLGLIVVDEEHDSSFKQNDPNPRYHARDAAIYLAQMYEAKVLLGTATPSLETFFNTVSKKYGLVKMHERFGGIEMPEIVLVNIAEEQKQRKMQANFSSVLIDELKATLARKEQAIIFQNRRGYAPTLHCPTCAWVAECNNCDVALTYHKHLNNLSCHYCGYHRGLPKTCPACGSNQITIKGYGTERIEDELQIFLPDARISRMDMDTVRTKHSHTKIINDFEEHRIDILVGTQMVTKGLDFEKVAIVGIISADHLLYFPDFRANERAFQLMTQVSGRAGRKNNRGKVIIQTYNPQHPVLTEVVNNDYESFFKREIQERKSFQYPPFFRLIQITLKHKDPKLLNNATRGFAQTLKEKLGERVHGPAIPSVSRVRNQYLLEIMLKLERDAKILPYAKQSIEHATRIMQQSNGFSGVQVHINVDPA